MVFFRLGTQSAAVSLAQVAGVHESVPVSPLPGLPSAVQGLATVQGQVVIVVDPLRMIDATAPPDAAPPADRANGAAGQDALFLLLDGAARGIALYLTPPLRLGPRAGDATLPANPRFALLCNDACMAPDGVAAGVVDPERLLAAVTPAPRRRR